MTSVRQPLFCPRADRVNGGKQTPINGPIDRVITWKSWLHSMVLLLYALCFTASFYRNWNTHYKSHMVLNSSQVGAFCSESVSWLSVAFIFCLYCLVSCLPDFCSTNNARNQVELLFDTSIIVRAAPWPSATVLGKQGVLFQTICMSTMDESTTCIWMIYLLLVHEINPR